VALYARISKDRNGEQTGVSRQLDECRDLVTRRGWTVVAEHVDNDISAYNGKRRPGYLALLEDLRNGEADAIVCWHPDRLTRNPRELEDLLDVIESRRLAVATVQAGDVDLSTSSGRAVARTLVAWAKHESEHKGARQQAAIADAAKRGERHGFVPYGWRSEAEAEVVREVVARLLAGSSLRSIMLDLNARGVSTVRGGQWSGKQVRQLALRPSNAGLRTHNGAVVAAGDWPALVSADDHERVVRLLTDPARRTVQHGRKHVLSGIARCGKCGGALRFATLGTRRVYRCVNLDVSASAEPLTAFVLELVDRRLNAPDAAAVTAPGTETYDGLASRLAALRGRLDGLAADYADGLLDRVQVRVAGDRLRGQVGQTEALLRERERKDAALRARGVDVFGLSVDRQRALLRGLLTVRLLPATRQGAAARKFDFDRVQVEWL
jgi:DNA invertase Pin-like site-specific DNA recombinase